MTASWPLLLLTALLLMAVMTDLRSRRISNSLVLTGSALALAAHALMLEGPVTPPAGPGWWSPLAGLATGLAALMPLYLLRALGAGDVKLMAMVGAFVGAPTVLTATLYTLLAGGLLSLAVMLVRGVAVNTLANVHLMLIDWSERLHGGRSGRSSLTSGAPLQTTAARLPYALAIAAGTVAALVQAR